MNRKPNQSKKRGSVECSIQEDQTCKVDGLQVHILPGKSKDTNSPYKNALGQIQRLSLTNDGEDDFSTPKPIKPVPKMLKLKPPLSKKRVKKKSLNPILKRTKDNFRNTDMNAEHLQMALALSKSTFAEEYPEREKEIREEDLPTFLSPQNIPKVTTFLEKYGFKSSKNHSDPDISKKHSEERQKRKKSKFRFLTPILYTRTDEERESLINSKVSVIISQQQAYILEKNLDILKNINSQELKKYLNINNRCWDTENCNKYLLPCLQLSPSKPTLGSLLKNWEEIPGRDKSPQRCLNEIHEEEKSIFQETKSSISSETTDDNCSIQNKRRHLCSSPDLFCSDDDSFCTEISLKQSVSSSKSLESPLNTTLNSDEDISEIIVEKFSSISSKSKTKESSQSSTRKEKVDHSIKCSPRTFTTRSNSPNKYQLNYPYKPFVNSLNKDYQLNPLTNEKSSLSTPYKSDDEKVIVETFTSAIKMSQSIKTSKISDERCSKELEYSSSSSTSRKYIPLKPSSNKIGFESLFVNKKSKIPSEKLDPEISSSKYFIKTKSVEISPKFANEVTLRSCYSSSKIDYFDVVEKNDKGIEFFESFYDDTEKYDDVRIDLSQSSDEDEQLNEISDLSQNINEKRTDISKVVEEDASLENVDRFSNIRLSLTAKRLSMDSRNISLDYNNTKSLNVTDYLMDVLNSQDDVSNPDEDLSQSQSTYSQETIEISSDEELNYSSRLSALQNNENIYDLDNFNECIGSNFGNQDLSTVYSNLRSKYTEKQETHKKQSINNEISPPVCQVDTDQDCTINITNNKKSSLASEEYIKISTPEQTKTVKSENFEHSRNFDTPNNNLIIKTKDITPMADYEVMDTPKIRKELDKFGIKPLKRQRGVELLKYIYDSTHPVVSVEDFHKDNPEKKRRLTNEFKNDDTERINIVGTEVIQRENEADLLFERRFSKKIPSCRIPLQIAWYNFLCCNQSLKKNILLYEPIQLEVVHSMLKEQSGCNFHIEELITFFDKKCITFRTSQWQGANKKQAKAKS